MSGEFIITEGVGLLQQESRFLPINVEIFPDLVYQIKKDIWKDKNYKEILKQLEGGQSFMDYSLEPQAKLLLFKERVVIPRNNEKQSKIPQERHESLLAGHPFQEKTLNLIKRYFN
ncbi:hypothetical protein O181_009525 [Austropuccinia psidii MF-1]|uniref:Uncharacterized protein n=1 Tax=Austropuccinia psidii MF-1 TaxID=1389203 RepID=A0A9Q3GK04_9BASI|nr:hypothetical protein [Austropuccinia psidii MF-1]